METTESTLRVLQELYDSEISFLIEARWDDGFDVRLGGNWNSVYARANMDTMEEAVVFLKKHAIIHFPESEFAKRRG